MYNDGIMNCWIINELNSEYEPYERLQILIWNEKINPPSGYQYYPSIPKGCEIAAEINITRIGNKFNIHKMFSVGYYLQRLSFDIISLGAYGISEFVIYKPLDDDCGSKGRDYYDYYLGISMEYWR